MMFTATHATLHCAEIFLKGRMIMQRNSIAAALRISMCAFALNSLVGSPAFSQLTSCCEVQTPPFEFDEPRFSLPAELSGGFALQPGATTPFRWSARVLPTWPIGQGLFRVGVGGSATFFNPKWEARATARVSFNLRNILSAALVGTRIGIFWLSLDGSYGKVSGGSAGLSLQYDFGPRNIQIGASITNNFGSSTSFESSVGSDILAWSYERRMPVPYSSTDYYDRVEYTATDEMLSRSSVVTAYKELAAEIAKRDFKSCGELKDSLSKRGKRELSNSIEPILARARRPVTTDCKFVLPTTIDKQEELSHLLKGWNEAANFPYRVLAKEACKQAVYYRDGLNRIDTLPEWRSLRSLSELKRLLASHNLDANRIDSSVIISKRIVQRDGGVEFFGVPDDERNQVDAIREGFCKAVKQWKGMLPGTIAESSGEPLPQSTASDTGKTALVISGGGSKGAFAVGAIEHLVVDKGIRFDMVCGTSTGALIAPFIAAHQLGMKRMVHTLQDMYTSFSTEQLTGARNARELLRESSVFSNDGLQKRMLEIYTSDLVDTLINSARVTMVVVTVNLNSGETKYFYTGKELKVTKGIARRIINRQQFIDAVLASASFEVLLPPRSIHWYGDSLYGDAGLTDVLPVKTAIDNGASTIYAIPLSSPTRSHSDNMEMTFYEVLFRILDIYDDEVQRDKRRYDSLYTEATTYINELKEKLNANKDIPSVIINNAFVVKGKDLSGRPSVTITYIQPERSLSEAFNIFTIAFDPQAMTEMMMYGKRRAKEAIPQEIRQQNLVEQARR